MAYRHLIPRKRSIGPYAAEAAIILLVLGLMFAAAFGGWAVGHVTRETTAGTASSSSATFDPAVAAGAHIFVQFACAQCHGEQGRGGVSPDVPKLSTVGKKLQPAELRTIIDHGLGASKDPTKPYMPVWGQVISTQQVSDLISYIRAGLPKVPTADPPLIPQGQGAAVEGSVLYVRYGCINCHGPNGLGGVPNPQSPDKTIPPLAGAGFHTDFNTDQKIIDMIRSGSVLGRAPIVSMPHWGGIIPNDQLLALTAYLKTLKTG
jgi:cbb3-type cytochrome c oxidase subunit III